MAAVNQSFDNMSIVEDYYLQIEIQSERHILTI